MSFYKNNKNQILTLQLISQILGKIKLEYAAQEPQWAHVILEITTRGFSTGLLKFNDLHFDIEVNLMDNIISIRTEHEEKKINLENEKTISTYYHEILKSAESLGLYFNISTKPQEMEVIIPFDEDTTHHHYNHDLAKEIHKWFQFAWDAQQQFIAPFRQRKVYPGLFWGTFDVACILVYNELESFPDDSKVIERAAFDEQMIEFGFWLGDENFDYPTFFTLPYPFVDGVELEIDETFPKDSYFSPKMAEYLYEFKDGISQEAMDKAIQFMEASCVKSFEYLKWKNTDHYFEDLKMKKNKK